MNEPQPPSPRERLQALLAIPERQRTDAEWDEINELEIELASGNRQLPQQQGIRRNDPATANRPGPGGPRGKRQSRRFRKRGPP